MFETFTGTQYLQMDIACMHDKAFEKEDWSDRIAHFHTLNLDDPSIFKAASNPIGLRAAVNAYQDTLNGIPTGYTISLDACSSGLQILSILVSCPKSYSLCGGNGDECVDSYTEIFQSMGLSDRLTRKDVKAGVMTALYGSTATPKRVFADNVELFYETMEREAPGAWDLNIGLQEIWADVKSNQYSWSLPDNFHAHITTHGREVAEFKMLDDHFDVPMKTDEKPEFHKGLGPNIIHSIDGYIVREMARRCMFKREVVERVIASLDGTGVNGEESEMVQTLWEAYEDTGMLSVRILDYLNEDTMGIVDPLVVAKMIQTLPTKPFEMMVVHDCFRCHPNNGDMIRRQYNQIMADLNDSTLLRYITSQVTGSDTKARKVGQIPQDQILEANYMLA